MKKQNRQDNQIIAPLSPNRISAQQPRDQYQDSNQSQKLDVIRYMQQLLNQKNKKIQQFQTMVQRQNQQSDLFKIKQQHNRLLQSINQIKISESTIQAAKNNEELQRLRNQIKELKKQPKIQKEVKNLCVNCNNFNQNILQNIKLKAQYEMLKNINSAYLSQNKTLNDNLKSILARELQKTKQVQDTLKSLTIKIQEYNSQNRKQKDQLMKLKQDKNSYSVQVQSKSRQIQKKSKLNQLLSGLIKDTLSMFKINFDKNQNIDQKMKIKLLNDVKKYLDDLNKNISQSKDNLLKASAATKKSQQKSRQLSIQIQQKNGKISQCQIIVNSLQSQIQRSNKQNNRLKAQTESLKKQIKDFEDLLKSKSAEINGLQSKNKQLQKKVKDLSEINKNQSSQITVANAKIQEKDKLIQVSKKKIDQLNLALSKASQRLKQLQKNILSQRAISSTRKQEWEKQQNSHKETNDKLTKIKLDLQKKISEMKTKQKEFEEQLRKVRSISDVLNNKLDELKKEKEILQDKNKKQESELENERNKNLAFLQIIQKINRDLISSIFKTMTGAANTLDCARPENIEQLDREIDSFKQILNGKFLSTKFFNGSAIVPSQKIEWVFDQLQGFTKNRPSQSRLVYKYDPLNSTNFHKYFDGISNLLLFIKLAHGPIIGGFTVYPVQEKIQKPGKAFIFNLTYEKSYKMRQDPRLSAVTYDIYYFILGNAEIRLRSQEKKVFSNFGIANSTFDNGSDQRTKFLDVKDSSNNELDIEEYEFYEIKFEE